MKRRYILTHRHLFFIGWAYYLVVPLTLGYAGIFDQSESLNLLGRYYDEQSPNWPFLVIYAFAAAFLFFTSSLLIRHSRSIFHPTPSKLTFPVAFIILLLYSSLAAILTAQARSLVGAGYSDDFDISLIGPLATLQMLILYQYLYERTTNNRAANAFAILLIFNSAVLLSMGGRLYVISSLVAIYFRWWNWSAKSFEAQIGSLFMIIAAPVALVAIGMWRVGDTNYDLIGFYLVSESTFTSISAFTLFTGGLWSTFFDIPYEFIAAFANIVPNALWPEKAEWLNAVSVNNQNFESPYGAASIIASTVGNFGFVGGLLFFGAVGIYMSAAARTRGDAARITHYCFLVGLLPFMFFRDPFQVQIKVVITGLILFWMTTLLRKSGSAASTSTRHAARGRPNLHQARLTGEDR